MQRGPDETLRARTADAMRALAAWAAAAVAQPLPADVRRRAAVILMDDLGAMVAGAAEPQVAEAAGRMLRAGGPAEAAVFAPGAPRTDRATAAAANGMAATWCELDEGYRGAPCHAGAYLLPAMLAEAEATGASVGDVLAALAVAYEITTRLARAFRAPVLHLHPHAGFATIGAAASVAALRRHDAATLLDAVSGAASMAFAGPYGHAPEGALVRNAWTSAGAWVGLRAADWAEAGIGGIPETPYDVFAVLLGHDADPAALTNGLGEDWAVRNGYHKVFACCQYAHAAVEATLALRGRLPAPDAVEALEEILVETHPLGLTLTTAEPRTVLAAKFSMPHAAASVARLGTGGRQAFATATLHDDAIAALRRRVRLAPLAQVGAPPNDRPARVTWRFRGGEEWSETCESARGGADRPLDEGTLRAKLADNLGGLFPAMPAGLEAIVAGTPAALAQRWGDAVAALTAPGRA